MDIWSTVVFSAFVMASGAGLMVWHVRAWRKARCEPRDALELDFRRRQYSRRMQTSAMLAILGLAILVGRLLMAIPLSPWLLTVHWVIVLGVLLWIALLALTDIWATKHYYGRLRDRYFLEQERLQTQLRRLRATRGNGQPDRPTDPSNN